MNVPAWPCPECLAMNHAATKTCATLRRRCREEYARLSHLAEEYDVAQTTIAAHVRGECEHDHDTPAVERGDA